MNTSPVAEALRFAVTQTVRALTQPGGIQAIAAELQQQPQARAGNAQAPTAQQTLVAQANESASVELSPAALMPPVDAAKQLAATRGATATPLTVAMLSLPQTLANSRPGDSVYSTEALRLAVQLKLEAEAPPVATLPLASLLRSVSSQSAMANYAAMQPTLLQKRDEVRPASANSGAGLLSLGGPADEDIGTAVGTLASRNVATLGNAASPAAAAPGQLGAAGPNTASPSATQILRADLAYQEFAPRNDTPARIDLYRFGQREGDADNGDGAIETLGATIYLHLPELGEIVVTLAIAGREVDLAIAAPSAVLTALRAGRDDLALAAQAWGVRMRGISFVPFDRPVSRA
jgi:hypothetical protein